MAKSDFNARIAHVIVELSKQGKTNEQIAAFLGIAVRTLYRWKNANEALSHAMDHARVEVDDLVEEALFSRAVGYQGIEEKVFAFYDQKREEWITHRVPVRKQFPPDTSAARFWLMNRRPEVWTDRNLDRSDRYLTAIEGRKLKSYTEFCLDAGYAKPFEKQIEMTEFVTRMNGEPRMLLGSRGYGKTEYCVVMGIAYALYVDWFKGNGNVVMTTLLITKSDERNASILNEIRAACEVQGIQFEKANATMLRIKGLIGTNHSVSSLTLGSKQLRGKHPKLVVMEDVVTDDDNSESDRIKARRKYEEAMKLVKNICLVGQPAHKDDLYQILRSKIETMEVPHGTIPELDHDLEAQRLAGVSEKSIQMSYFLNVPEDGSTPFGKIKFLPKWIPGGSAVCWIDPSFTGKDRTGVTILKGHFDGVMVQGYSYADSWENCLDRIIAECEKLGVKRIGFECNSLGEMPIRIIREKVASKGIGVMGKVTVTNKHSRIMNAGVYAEKIHLSRESHQEYIDLVLGYEKGAKIDDPPDSLATCLEWVGLIKGK